MRHAVRSRLAAERAMAEQSCDIAIVGGGGMGSAAAYFLAAMAGSALSVAVFEPDPTYARASTALAAGGIRQQFSTPENILMSQFGYRFFETIADVLATDDERPDIGLTPKPYLRLAGGAARDVLRRHCDLQQSLGAGSTWLEPADIAARYPWMATEDVAAAILGGAAEGMFDPYSMLQAFRRKAQALGVRYHRAAVTGLETGADGRTIETVRLDDGAAVRCGVVINAAGPRAAGVAAMGGIELPVEAVKAQSFVFRAEQPLADCPILLDQVQGVQLKPEGDLYVCAAPGRGDAVEADDFDPEPDLFEQVVWPRVAARVPQFERLRLVRGWVGHVEINRLDHNPVLGLHPARPNFYFLTGFSGHGAQHVPAAGRAIAELILYGAYRSLDLSRFGFGRVIRNQPLLESA
jgi:FAD-dependent oxidoreductase domain-containing protein 1